MMKVTTRFCISAALWAITVGATAAPPATPAERETWFKSNVSGERLGGYIKTLTAHPTTPGGPFSRTVAEKTRDMLLAWGWDAKIEPYRILFPRPIERKVELLGDKPFRAKLDEPAIPGDPYSAQKDEIIPPFFIYGPDGDVTAPLVYANFGLRSDYEQLERLGVSVKDKIVIVRVGGVWRGGKVELAAEHGAKGILIYSDPKEDGYYRELPYPEGPGRTPDGVQRGSILYGKYPGDPSTPFEPSVEGAKRVALTPEASTIAAIPAMPLSFADAQPLLASLGGQIVPEPWRGALPISYRVGPSDAMVHLKMRYDWDYVWIYDVSARLKGTVYPRELVLRGNHHDGWVHGAQDPHSGHAAMLEEARLLGQAYKDGWRPKRTIVYNSWDAEEQGVIGSTEWAEAHAREISENAVAYINTDVSGAGILTVSGSSALADFISRVGDGITDPDTGIPVTRRLELKNDFDIYQAPSSSGNAWAGGGPRTYDRAAGRVLLGAPGYGSDHQVFVSHFGIPTLNVMFWGEDSLGAYHTGYDNYQWYTRFNDPHFRYAAATAQMNGIAVMRLADADILPMTFTPLADAVATEVAGLERLYQGRRAAIERENDRVGADAYELLAFRNQPRQGPAAQTPPELDLTPLKAPLEHIRSAAARYDAAVRSGPSLAPSQIAVLNKALGAVDRAFLRPSGLPDRPHYRNELYSPGRLWDTVPFPAVGDAILDGDWARARQQVPAAAVTLAQIADALERALDLLNGSAK